MKLRAFFLLGTLILSAPLAAADNIAACEVLIAERIEDEATGGSALISSYRPAGEFMSTVYDDEPGHLREIDGHNIRAVLCERKSAVPSLRDYPILETGIPLSLSQNFDSARSDVVIIRFKDGEFRASYTGPGLTAQTQDELDDVLEVFNLQPNDLAAREAAQKAGRESSKKTSSRSFEPEPEPELISEPEHVVEPELERVSEPESVPEIDTALALPQTADITIVTLEPDVDSPAEDALPLADLNGGEIKGDAENAARVERDDALIIDAPADKNVADATFANVATIEGPPIEADINTRDLCLIIARDSFGQLQELNVLAQGLENTLEQSPVFVFPVPPGLNLRAIRCSRSTLTPQANDYKVARAGYPFFYEVDGVNKRVAGLEFSGGKFRMNLVEGDFTPQELIDAKARILSFNEQHLKDIQAQRKETQ